MVCEQQRGGCRKANLERANHGGAWWVLERREQLLAVGCKAACPRADRMVSGAVSPQLWWLRAWCPIPSSLSPASSRGAWQSTARAARLIFSSVPSLAPAPTSSPRTASPAPTKTCRYISARSNHLGLSQPRTQTDSKPTKRGCQPLDNRLWGVTLPPPHNAGVSSTPSQTLHACCSPHEQGPWKGTARKAPAWVTGVRLGVIGLSKRGCLITHQ